MEQDYRQQLQQMTDGLDEWCMRQNRRRAMARRSTRLAVALSAVIGAAALLMPPKADTWVQGARDATPQWAYVTTERILSGL